MDLFDKAFAGTVQLTKEEKMKAVGDWLKNEYSITAKDKEVLSALLEIHDEGSDQQHFAHPEITSSFVAGNIQLVRFKDGWHLVYRPSQKTEHVVLHPKSEGYSYEHPLNRKSVSEVRTLLKNGSLKAAPTVPAEPDPRLTAADNTVLPIGLDGKSVSTVSYTISNEILNNNKDD